MEQTEEITYLYSIIHDYTVFFLIFDLLFFFALIAAIVFALKYLKSKAKLHSSTEFLFYTIHGQEAERARIARELHDTLAQDLRYCQSLTKQIADKELQEELSELLEKSVDGVRSMSYNLAPPDIIKNDLPTNIMNLGKQFGRKSSASFRLTVSELLDTSFLSPEDNLNLYRIVQESLTNVSKHADAHEVTVLLRNQNNTEEKGLYIFITDDGKGFLADAPQGTKESLHLGLLGMAERARFIGAEFKVDSVPGEGTQVSVIKKTAATKHYREPRAGIKMGGVHKYR